MKKNLLLLASALLLSTGAVNAQKTWDFGNDTTQWPLNATAFTNTVTVDGLDESAGGGGGFGIVRACNPSPFPGGTITWPDTYTAVNEFTTGGASSGNAGVTPTSRYFKFTVPAGTGNITIRAYFRSNAAPASPAPAVRSLKISDGVTTLVQADSANLNSPAIALANYTGTSTTFYVYGTSSINIQKIEWYPTLSTHKSELESALVVSSQDGKINLSNVEAATKVNVYNVLGALVQSTEITADASLEANSGVYIVKTISTAGSKTTKVIVQ